MSASIGRKIFARDSKRLQYVKLQKDQVERLRVVLKLLVGRKNEFAKILLERLGDNTNPAEVSAILTNYYSQATDFVVSVPNALQSVAALASVTEQLAKFPVKKS